MREIRFEYDCEMSLPHFHDELEILYVLSGRTGVMLDGKNYLMKQEEFSVFNPFERHEIFREAGSHTLSAYIPVYLLQYCEVGPVRCCSTISRGQDAYLELFRARLAMIYKNYLEKDPSRRLHILSGIYGLLAILKQQFEEAPYNASQKEDLRFADRMREVLVYIHGHYTDNISLQEVAEKNYMSAGHLSRQFEKQMGMHFSEYLRKLRLRRAADMLRYTDKTVNEISEDCGFFNVNTLTANFKTVYGDTPSGYRKKEKNGGKLPESVEKEPANAIRLLRYASAEEELQPLDKRKLPETIVKTDLNGTEPARLILKHNMAINCGYAKDYLAEDRRKFIEQSVREIGHRFIFIQGILDDTMNVYHEYPDGTPWFNDIYLDAIVDHICSVGARPWFELSHTPEKLVDGQKHFFGDGYLQLPSDLHKWEMLIDHVLCHLISRYGKENVETWRFSVFSALFISYGMFSMDEYLAYYHCTWKTIRNRLPAAKIISGAFDSGRLILDGEEILTSFLRYCREQECLPDEIGLQDFAVDYSGITAEDTAERLMDRMLEKRREPAPPSDDPDILQHHLMFVKKILAENFLEDLPICLVYCSSTIWCYELGNDTAYKAAFVVKNCLENADLVSAINLNLLSDMSIGIHDISTPFYGDIGDMNYMGIPKASYHAHCMMSRLLPVLLARGDGYVVTASEDRNMVRILLYHYCHYDLEMHLEEVLPREEQLTIDRYCGFLNPGVRCFRLALSGLGEGEYDEEGYMINRECGSSYDIWTKIGAPQKINKEQKEYLIQMSQPGYYYKRWRAREGEKILLSAVLDTHEVRMICLTKRQ